MARTASSKWCLALWGLLLFGAAACHRSDSDQRGSGGAMPAEPPMTKVEDDARREFHAFLNDPKLGVVPDEARLSAPRAKAALDATFAELDPALRNKIDASRPARCLRNGCFKDVVYQDWATYWAVDQAVLSGPQPSAFVRYQGAQYRTGRSPVARGGFVVTWALMFPISGPAK